MTYAPGTIRDSIISYLSCLGGPATVAEIHAEVARQLGPVAASSVRSYLNINTPHIFQRTDRGCYGLARCSDTANVPSSFVPAFETGGAKLYHADCFEWLSNQASASVHAVVTDPPYGLLEYSAAEQIKLANGRGGVWRIPPAFDGHKRSPLPRFTVLGGDDLKALYAFFKRLGLMLRRVVVPGANILIASNPLIFHIVLSAMSDAGLEPRGTIVRLVMTMRGGDRPKNAHLEFPDVSVIPRSMWEPWVMLRKPLEGRVQDNLRKWKTGGFRRPSAEQPFGDVVRSNPTSRAERLLAPHPSLKPQEFLRRVVRAVLPLGEGVILDPFSGSGSTLAAASAVGYESIGLEKDPSYFQMAVKAVPALAMLSVTDASSSPKEGVGRGGAAKATKRFKAGSY